MKEGYLYKKLKEEKVKCETCCHYCTVLPGQRGICGTRENIKGKLFSLVYGQAIAEAVDPIEKKPLFHFLPGSSSLSIATVGCPFRCDWCQNWQISQQPKSQTKNRQPLIQGFSLPPEKIIEDAQRYHCQSISYTYTEPAIFLEYALDTMKLARKNGLKNVWVSDGYSSREAIELIAPHFERSEKQGSEAQSAEGSYLDAINVDLKAFKEETYQQYIGGELKYVLENIKEFYKRGVHLEITTLIIPGLNDSDKELDAIAEFIRKNLSPAVPWHLSRFFPNYKMVNRPPTPVETLQKAYRIGKRNGLKFVYLGNLAALEKESTFCPKCKELVIKRSGYKTEIKNVKVNKEKGFCQKCGEDLNLVMGGLPRAESRGYDRRQN